MEINHKVKKNLAWSIVQPERSTEVGRNNQLFESPESYRSFNGDAEHNMLFRFHKEFKVLRCYRRAFASGTMNI